MADVNVLESVATEMAENTPQGVGGNQQVVLDNPFLHNLLLSNFGRFYHPDGTHSDLPLPTFNPKRPTPYRDRVIQSRLRKLKDGKRWWFTRPQRDPPELPLRCFVEPGGVQCTKRLRTLNDLHMHVMAKHFEESKMYADVLDAMKKKTQMNLEPTVAAALSLDTAKVEGPELFHCTVEGCGRFFDTEQGQKLHERKGHK
jgi:hypothetical protein